MQRLLLDFPRSQKNESVALCVLCAAIFALASPPNSRALYCAAANADLGDYGEYMKIQLELLHRLPLRNRVTPRVQIYVGTQLTIRVGAAIEQQ